MASYAINNYYEYKSKYFKHIKFVIEDDGPWRKLGGNSTLSEVVYSSQKDL